jgi:hypothetical protein
VQRSSAGHPAGVELAELKRGRTRGQTPRGATDMCGVFGIRSEERDVSRLAYFALFALQHRGQESAGIAVSDHGRLTVLREMGLVAHVFNEQHCRRSVSGDRPHALFDDRPNRWATRSPDSHGGAHRRPRTQRQPRQRRGPTDSSRTASGSRPIRLEVIAALIARDPPAGRGDRKRDGSP